MSGARTVVSVSFDGAGRAGQYAVSPGVSAIVPGAWVVVESSRGRRIGRVTTPPTDVQEGGGRIRRVVRVANEDELAQQRAAQDREPEAFRLGLVAVRSRRLPVKLVRVVLDAMAGSATYCVVAPDRLDLTGVIDELSEALGVRVRMKQLGARDVAKVLGGVGRCGQELCCSTFLTEYPHTSVRIAKEQGLSLNDDRVAGVCGRTLCCLAYEQETYKERRGFLPKLGKRAATASGLEGKCIGADAMALVFTIVTDDGHRHRLHAREWDRNVGRALPDDEDAASADSRSAPEPEPISPTRGRSPTPGPSSTAGDDASPPDRKNPRRRRRRPKREPPS